MTTAARHGRSMGALVVVKLLLDRPAHQGLLPRPGGGAPSVIILWRDGPDQTESGCKTLSLGLRGDVKDDGVDGRILTADHMQFVSSCKSDGWYSD